VLGKTESDRIEDFKVKSGLDDFLNQA